MRRDGKAFPNTLSQNLFHPSLRFKSKSKSQFCHERYAKMLRGKRQKSSTNCFLLDWNPELILSEGVKSQRCPPTQRKKQTCIQAQLWGNIWPPLWQKEKANFHAIMKYYILQWHTNILFHTKATFIARPKLAWCWHNTYNCALWIKDEANMMWIQTLYLYYWFSVYVW